MKLWVVFMLQLHPLYARPTARQHFDLALRPVGVQRMWERSPFSNYWIVVTKQLFVASHR